ncbi:uncharacterized protein N7446_005477 [Penicillium canescens]|uniref:uncharacterized protein n=1 Tax=Penicillium canescens TaxID=5083 RepID=UPI0026DEF67B|nr:uncharacterized protein N7446_005477 [Penicillium canescens]KAJ6061357.1 hypothetical protein N7446_005477 [Penicillium canescens]KAJ6183506.1 hypothetical protein N7485_002148 [Penicillium canescens]
MPDSSAFVTINAMILDPTWNGFMKGIGSAKQDERLPTERLYSDFVIPSPTVNLNDVSWKAMETEEFDKFVTVNL